jgi:hypothetical protein
VCDSYVSSLVCDDRSRYIAVKLLRLSLMYLNICDLHLSKFFSVLRLSRPRALRTLRPPLRRRAVALSM